MQLFKQFIALLVPFMSLCVYAQDSISNQLTETQNRDSVVKFNYAGKGKFYSNANGETSEGVIIRLYGLYEEPLTDKLNLSFSGGVEFESDRTQDFYADSSSGNRLFLQYALVNWQPIDNINLKAGALNQFDTFKRRLMFSGIGVTFPGVLQEFTYDYKNIEFGLKLEQAIPVSRSYSTKVVESEETPSLFFEELFVDYNFSNKSRLSFNLGYFAFYDLPSVVAESSSLHGNIVSRQGPNESFFVYPFQGWSVSSTYCLCSNESYDFSVKFEYLNNVKAPSNYADASSLLLSLKHHNQISITDYELYVFEQKKQAAPSFYMSELFGYSNRAGVGLEAKHTFTKNNFFIGFSWVESRIIEVTPEQADQRTIQIYLGVDNA